MIRCIRFDFPKGNDGSKDFAEKILQTIETLKTLNSELFEKWYEQAYSRKRALEKSVLFDINYIEHCVITNWDKKFPDLGFHFQWWNGKEDDFSCAISFNLGKTVNNDNLSNVWNISFPFDEKYYKEHVSLELIKEIKKMGKEIWQPLEIKEFER